MVMVQATEIINDEQMMPIRSTLSAIQEAIGQPCRITLHVLKGSCVAILWIGGVAVILTGALLVGTLIEDALLGLLDYAADALTAIAERIAAQPFVGWLLSPLAGLASLCAEALVALKPVVSAALVVSAVVTIGGASMAALLGAVYLSARAYLRCTKHAPVLKGEGVHANITS